MFRFTVPSLHISIQKRNRASAVHTIKVSELVNWCFEPSQPLGIISGLKETFIKRHKVERTNKAEMRPDV